MKYFQFFFFHNLLILFYNIHSDPLYYAKNNTKEKCIDSYFEFGDFCYFICNGTLTKDDSGIINKCKCANNTHFIQEIEFGGLKYFQCVESCPNFYSITTRKCVDKCIDEEEKIKNNKGCTSYCGEDELYYESDGKKYCVKECPDDKKFYYKNSYGEKKCIQNCEKYHFYSNQSQGYECSDECENLSFIDLENNIFFCSSIPKESDSECTNSSFPYYFKGSCLRNCQDTQKLELFDNVTTYLFTNKDNKTYCSENCLEYYKTGTDTESTGGSGGEGGGEEGGGGGRILETKIDKSYIVPNQLLCVKDCSSTSYKFHNDTHCIESCVKKNNIDYYSVEDTGECVIECDKDNGYYLLREQQKCYHKDSPPKEYGKTFIDSNENEWVNCTNPNNENARNNYEGYFIKNYTKCMTSCPAEPIPGVSNGIYKYHKNGDNECLLNECKNNYPYIYYKSGDESICYESCKDIAGNYIYENGNECKNTMCENYYYKSSGIFKCLENDEDKVIKSCSNAGLYYLRGKECVKDCNNEEYKTPFKSDTNEIKKLGICSSECNFNGTTKFTFGENLCDDDCPFPYRKIKDKLEDHPIYKKISEGNCLLQCPNNYYEYDEEDGESLCLKNCPSGYYSFIISNDVKTCVKSCKEINKFLSNGECVDECKDSQNNTKYSYYYYNESKQENQCLDSCTKIGKFAFNALDNHQKCIDQCPDEYYHYTSDNLCITNCNNGFYKKDSEKICVTSCEDNEYIINGNKCTDEKCPKEEPFYVTKTFGSKNVKKCTSSCKNEGLNFYTNNTDGYECITTCLDVSFGDECMKECPQGTYKENNKCKPKCEESLFAIPKKKDNNEIYYECKNTCDKFIAFSNQCLDECPISENFIGLGNICKSSCNRTDGEFYKFFKNSTDDKYKIYTCVQNCGTKEYVINGKKECLDDCQYPPYYKSDFDRKCYLICSENPSYPFSTKKVKEEGGEELVEYICSTKCEKNEELYYGEDKICQNNCTGQNNIINGDNSCVSKCDLKSDYKFYYEDEQNNKYCKNSCPKYYSNKDFICTGTCEEPYGYLISQNQCDDKCPEGQFAIKGTETSDYKYKCDINCDSSSYYYDDQRICIDNCTDGYNIQGTKRCISSCDKIQSDGSSNYYFYEPNEGETQTTFKINTCVTECPSDKPFVDYNHHCSAKCGNLPYQYYNSSTKECLNKCDGVKLETDFGFECRENCPGDKFLDIITNTCKSSCSELETGNIYYYEEERKCIQECKKGDYIFKKDNNNNYICVSKCPEETFINGLECTAICPDNKNFVIARYEFGETELNKKCMTDCTSSYPFYKLENNLKKCYSSCDGYYITNKDPKINAKKCVDNFEDCKDNYSFSFKHNNTHKECFEICPNYAKFYDSNNNCYNNCVSKGLYHEKNNFLCIEECSSNTANYTTKECMSSCGINQKWIMKESTKLCLNNCNELDYDTFENIDGECVVSCPSNKFLIGNRGTKKCECQGLYYYNEEDYKECLAPNITSCENSNTEYIIQIDGESQCLKYCFGALSANGNICYMPMKESGVIKCPNNTKLEIIDGKLTCNCEYNYYNDENNGKICLGKEEKCPEKRYLIPDTKECVTECEEDYPYSFDNKCFKECPSGTEKNDNTNPKTCSCEYNKWYKISENNNDNYICLDENEPCNNNYPKLIKETNECVKNCGSEYIENDNICFSSCVDDYYKVEENGKNICRCKYKWYSNEKGVECKSENEDKDCEELNSELRFLIKETKECVISCPKEYPYYFNKECYKSCENEENLVDSIEDFECQCSGKWRVKNGTEIECISEPECGDDEYSLENQCIPNTTCPKDSYLFNKICYKECPTNTEIDQMKENECKCKSLWFRRDDGSIACLSENKCPYPQYPYLIQETNQCVKEETDCDNYLIFNYNCYFNCPINTIKNTENICICDKEKGFYKNITDNNGQTILECGLAVCPNEKPKYHNETKECVSNCIELNAYDYMGICYEECPPLTVKDDNNHICKLTEQFEDKNLTKLVKNLREEIKTIYENLPIGGLVINNENDATVQIYGLGKKNSEEKKNSIIRTNLAYIDLSGCIEKIYESNDMEPGDEIIVVKVDLKSKNKNLVVNPIEYEFVNSRTAEVLDASVCEKSEVVVSYPITYMLKNKNKLRNLDDESENEDDEEELKEKEIMDKFNRGKDLYDKDNSIDSFNYNSTIYRDICYPIKVDGKDMILENRITYFYPNYSFCESSCTYDKTDFAGERIYCNCTIKNEIEIDRPQTVKLVQYNQNETDNNQIGPTNIPVLKCISKAKISKNGAFYYCIILIVIEIGLLFVFIFQGYSSLNSKIRKKAFKEELNESNMDEDEKIEENKKNKISKYDNSNTDEGFKNEKKNNRDKSHPPQKNGNNANEGNDKNKDNEVINIKKHKNKHRNQEIQRIIDEKNNFEMFSEQNSEKENNTEDVELKKYLQKHGIDAPMAFYHSMRKEEKLLKEKYSISKIKDKFDSIIVVLTSIFDKIYFIKILLLSGKYEIISIMFSLYLLCHMMLLTFAGFFFDIKTLKKIWEKDDYPDLHYYLGYGFAGNLIVWVIFRIFCCLLENNNKVKNFMKREKSLSKIRKEKKYNKLMSGIKRNIIIYLCIQFALIMFCSFYLITFCGIYLGTKEKVFQAYGIAFIEIIIIKIIYGAILGVLRKVSLYTKKSMLYNVVLIFNKYIS